MLLICWPAKNKPARDDFVERALVDPFFEREDGAAGGGGDGGGREIV